MTTVFEAFRLPNRYETDGDVGLEIEVEGEDLPRTNRDIWRMESDGSLRGNSVEYVLAKPMSSVEKANALTYLDSKYIECGTVVHDSVRAGVHVHINVQDLTLEQMFSFIVAYIILEDILTFYCGQYRQGNLFCLRIRDADYLLYVMEKVAKKEYDLREFNSNQLRYSAINVTSLNRYGSLEFRAMRGTRNMSIINDWADMLLRLRDVSKVFDNASDVVSFLVEKGADAFLDHFLGDFNKTLGYVPKEMLDLNDGLYRAYDLAMETDWSSYKTKVIGGLSFPVDVEFPDEPLEDF